MSPRLHTFQSRGANHDWAFVFGAGVGAGRSGRAALLREVVMMGCWQSMNSAPRDGTFVLCYGMAFPELVEGHGRWFAAKERPRVPFIMVCRWVEGWYDKEIDIGDGMYRKERTQGYAYWAPEPHAFVPTRWMPLPGPPATEETLTNPAPHFGQRPPTGPEDAA